VWGIFKKSLHRLFVVKIFERVPFAFFFALTHDESHPDLSSSFFDKCEKFHETFMISPTRDKGTVNV
jgi:hypothetical protein